MRQYVVICAIAALQTAAGKDTERVEAATCLGRFTIAGKSCDTISAFAFCLAQSDPDDKFRASADNALAGAQSAVPNCNLRVTPSIKVVDRELRVVTQDDVKFQRFRRDEVGVFELKGMIEANTNQIAATAGLNDAITKSTNDAKTNHDALATKIDAVESKCDSTASTANTKITSNEAEITKLQAAVKTINESAEQAAATEVEVAASWQFVSNPILPTNRREAVGIRVVGKNFQQYDYSPDLAPFFECTFTLTSDASKKVVTAGQTSRTETATDPSFVVSCPSPVSIVTKSVFQLSLTWAGGEKPLKIPFNGAAGKDKLMFDMTWTALKGANGRIIVDVSGLDVAGKYVCVFTQPDNTNIRKTTDASFIDDVGRQLDCGPQPTGFAITGTSAAAIFELLVKGTKNKASYAGPTGAGPTVQLNTCANGIKDGEETDKDCGGLCGGCQGGKACKAKKDCVGAILCTNNKCVDSDGMLKSSAGKSCAEILKLNPGSKSGLKWIDPDDTGNAFQVYCNQEDDGGGWILLQHIEKVGGNFPCRNNAYRQPWAAWENAGIGSVKDYDNMSPTNLLKSSRCHWQPFKNWGRIIGYSDSAGVISTMKLVGDKGFSAAVTMNNFYVDKRERYKYGLRMSNYAQIKRMMCSNGDNCFASPNVGFSTIDKDRDSYSGFCTRDHYGGVGWWQAHCHNHHLTKSGISQGEFDGTQGTGSGNGGTQHWSWYVK